MSTSAGQPRDQHRILKRTVAVIDPVDAQDVERFVDIGGRALLAGVRAQQQPGFRRCFEHARELRRWMPHLGRIEPDADHLVEPGLGLFQRPERIVLVEMPQIAHDQPDAHPVLRPRRIDPREQTVGDDVERDAAMRVRLRIEEDLGMAHIVGGGAREIGAGEVAEVGLGAQDVGALVIDVEEVLQPAEAVGGAQRFDARERDVDAVAPRQLEHLLGLERALDMHMELGLRQPGDEVGKVGHRVAA